MNALPRARRRAVRRQSVVADRPAARRVGFRRLVVADYFAVKPAPRVPPRRRRRGGAAAVALTPGSTSSCRRPTATAIRYAGASTAATSWSSRRRGGRPCTAHQVPARPLRAAVRRHRSRSHVHTRTRGAARTGPRGRRGQPRAPEERRRPAARPRRRPSVAVHRTERGERPQLARRLQPTSRTSSRCSTC